MFRNLTLLNNFFNIKIKTPYQYICRSNSKRTVKNSIKIDFSEQCYNFFRHTESGCILQGTGEI